ncbi:S26 family signal peptidase [Aquidulcibacter sp.]|jgi:type IV secretory pathway protease TraF|uniref:S26 family signal peptidase n=1 Tax=Aquidulcibacter sp. TaxID=2052990 RepID=UPI0037C0B6C2
MNTSALVSIVVANALLASAPALPELVANPPAIINETISMQKGLYVRTGGVGELKHGYIIAMPMNQNAKDYLVGRLGYPADTMLIKRVVALPGETVCRQAGTVTVRGRAVHADRRDSQGTLLPFWVGCHTLLPTEVFLLGDHPSSFDSRYFGPVLKRDLSGTYQEVISW